MDRPPPLAIGYTRFALLLDKAEGVGPADIAKATGVSLDHLGPIVVNGREAWVDVQAEVAQDVRNRLDLLGPTQVLDNKLPSYSWLRLALGRNHGFSPAQMRRILEAADAGPVGKFEIKNTHTMVGILDSRIDAVLTALSAQRLNGVALTPERVQRSLPAAFRPPPPSR